MRFFILAAALVAVGGAPAGANLDRDYRHCRNFPLTLRPQIGPTESRIKSCTRVLDSGWGNNRERANLHQARAQHYHRLALVTKGRNNQIAIYKKTVSDYSKAIKLDPTNAQYYYNRGLIYEIVFKDRKKAIADYRAGYKLNPDSESAARLRHLGAKP